MNKIKLDLIDLLDEILTEGKYSNLQMNHYFKVKGYSKKERAFITNIIHNTLKKLIFIDYLIEKKSKTIKKRRIKQLIRISVCQFLIGDKADYAGIVYEAVEMAKIINPHQSGFVNSLLKNIFQEFDQLVAEIPEDKKIGIELSYPQWFVTKISVDYPENYLEILKSYKEKSHLSFRINPKQFSVEKFRKLALENDSKILLEIGNVFYVSNSSLLGTKEFKENKFYVQDASSYLAVMSLDIKNEDVVLDACSAPGGKTMAILQEYNPKLLVATDIHEHKIKLLETIKRENKFENLDIILNDARNIENLNRSFDKILLDVPCTGLGVLRKKPEKIYTLENAEIKKIKKIQKDIFSSAYNSLAENGELVYSTCTFTKEENTNNIAHFLEKYSDLTIEKVELPENIFVTKDEYGGNYIDYRNEFLDGFYIAKFRKKGNNGI